jgi:predicted MFS family arabinose efflux permease
MAQPTKDEKAVDASRSTALEPSTTDTSHVRAQTRFQKIYHTLSYTPKRCRYDPEKPFEFSMGLNVLFAFAGCFTVANLYYTHPILNKLAVSFAVTDEQASYIPTLAQAGYAAGLLFLCPLGDLLKRRPFVLWLVAFTAVLWIGLCVTSNFALFCAITFITSVTTVTPQLMLPLVGDMAPPHKRATSLSIVVSGMLLGMLLARVLSGIVTEYIGWRYIYWIAFGLQSFILVLLYWFMPDYPSTNPDVSIVRKYPSLLVDIGKLVFKYPVLVQACLIGFFTSSTFTSYWTTLTFLLAGPPYHYNNLVIGCFGFIGIISMTWGPIFARTFMEGHQPLISIIIGELICATGIIIGTYTGRFSVAGPIIQAFCLDVGLQTSQIGNRTAIFGVEPLARNRVNTAYMVSVFCGQLMGTAAGNHLYAQGGWIRSGSASVGFIGAALVFCVLRGPHETGWIGWHGGANMKKPRMVKPIAGSDLEAKGKDCDAEEKQPQPFVREEISEEKSGPKDGAGTPDRSSVTLSSSEKTLGLGNEQDGEDQKERDEAMVLSRDETHEVIKT